MMVLEREGNDPEPGRRTKAYQCASFAGKQLADDRCLSHFDMKKGVKLT